MDLGPVTINILDARYKTRMKKKNPSQFLGGPGKQPR
jgi:hypothetical protein